MDFKLDQGNGFGPTFIRSALSMPTPINSRVRGRIELSIGRLGAGKTTWSALRAKRLARLTDRPLVTNGVGWPEPWTSISSVEELQALRSCVVLFDEFHLIAPSSKGLLPSGMERELLTWLSLLRKRDIDVIGTTQAWTRVATHVRQLVTTVWICDAVRPGKRHRARAFDPPSDGGRLQLPPQWYGPAAAKIPTNAEVWFGMPLEVDADDPEIRTAEGWKSPGEQGAARRPFAGDADPTPIAFVFPE